jgi:tRNA (adenine-N(1)-)-methyltransferase non-catalytic subunit
LFVWRRRTVKIGDKSCSLQPLVGRPFGTLFRVEPAGLVPCAAAATDAPSQGKEDSVIFRLLVEACFIV